MTRVLWEIPFWTWPYSENSFEYMKKYENLLEMKAKQQIEYNSGEMKAVLVSGQKMTLCLLRWIRKPTEW